MLWMKAVAKCMADHIVSHNPTMPRIGKIAKTIHTAGGLKHGLHASMITMADQGFLTL
jgi:hypothetical protein